MSEKSWFSLLSLKQRVSLVVCIIAMFAIVAVGLLRDSHGDDANKEAHVFSVEMSIKNIAPKLGITGKSLARELGLLLSTPKQKALREFGVFPDELEHAVEHIMSHHDTMLKYYIYAALVLGGLVFMVGLGRPNMSDVKDRKLWYPKAVYVVFLLVSVGVAGFLLGKSPNPMEGAVKTFKCMVGLYPDPYVKVIAFAFFVVMAIVGNKMICGWACPFGSLQELLYTIPVLKKIKKRKLPFKVTNTIRTLLFFAMLLMLFGIVGGRKGYVIYHNLNPFNLFDLDFDSIAILATVVVMLIASFFTYRPFCQLICPFGLISWGAERFSIFRVRIDQDLCTRCGACVKACPSEAAGDILNEKILKSDCFSCGRCLTKCSVDAIKYGMNSKKTIDKQ